MTDIKFDESTIDWDKAPEGYDYFIIHDHNKTVISEFHKLGKHFGEDVYFDFDGRFFPMDFPDIKVYKRPEEKKEDVKLGLPKIPFVVRSEKCVQTYRISERKGHPNSLQVLWENGVIFMSKEDVLCNIQTGVWQVILDGEAIFDEKALLELALKEDTLEDLRGKLRIKTLQEVPDVKSISQLAQELGEEITVNPDGTFIAYWAGLHQEKKKLESIEAVQEFVECVSKFRKL